MSYYTIFKNCHKEPSLKKRIQDLQKKLSRNYNEKSRIIISSLLCCEKRIVSKGCIHALKKAIEEKDDFEHVGCALLLRIYYYQWKKKMLRKQDCADEKKECVVYLNRLETLISNKPPPCNFFISQAHFFIASYYKTLLDEDISRQNVKLVIKNLKLSLEKDKTNFYAYNAWGDLRIKTLPVLKNFNTYLDKAEKEYRQALFHSRNRLAEAYVGLGNVFRERMHFRKAIENYKIAIEIDPTFCYPHNYIGDCYRSRGMHLDALNMYLRAISLAPHLVYSWYGYGKTLYDMAKISNDEELFHQANLFFRHAIKISPNFPYPYLDYARSIERLHLLNPSLIKFASVKIAYEKADGVFHRNPKYYRYWIGAIESNKFEGEL